MNVPAVPGAFHWTGETWGAALRCGPLEPVAPHLFTTRHLPLASPEDWQRVAEALGARSVQTLTQVHGCAVVTLRKGVRLRDDKPEADVLVSDDPDVAIAVRAADCVPILIADQRTGAVAAVHAGWRGTAAGAATAAVKALERDFGARPADLIAAIGPSIGPCCYEVGSELVDAFAAAGHERHLIDRWFISIEGRLRLDTWAANRDQLTLAGLDDQNIHSCGLCTATNLNLFPSYRAEGQQAGRIAGAIKVKGKR